MFTGIIEEVGHVKSFQPHQGAATLEIVAMKTLEGLQVGDSVAVNGVCLTVRERVGSSFQAQLSQETLTRSNLSKVKSGTLVNLERPLLPTSRLGGHFVQGHVDGIGKVLSIETQSEYAVMEFSLPPQIQAYLVEKGSIAVDGISLTVSLLKKDAFQVALIPHTLENTNLRTRRVGEAVNLECDVLAKYVESLLRKQKGSDKEPKLTEKYLREQGY